MAVTISIQPAINELMAGYLENQIKITANQSPTGLSTDPCPIVFFDIYINNTYYASVSVTDYAKVTTGLPPVTTFEYLADLQDKIQEYLQSNPLRAWEGSAGLNFETSDLYSCKVEVKIRESYIDTNGFLQTYRTAPVMATKYTNAIAGTGTVTSKTFYALNATKDFIEQAVFENYLNEFMVYQGSTDYKRLTKKPINPTMMANPNKIKAGGGVNYIQAEDRDVIYFYSKSPAKDVTIYADITFRNGSVLSKFKTLTGVMQKDKVGYFRSGLYDLQAFYGETFNIFDVVKYDVYAFNVPFAVCVFRQSYEIKTRCPHERIVFLNSFGVYDAINLYDVIENRNHASKSYQKRKMSLIEQTTLNTKSVHSLNRGQVATRTTFEGVNYDFSEKDAEYIKDLYKSNKAYIIRDNKLYPIVIQDVDAEVIKRENKFEYIVRIKYSLSVETLTQR